MLALASQLLKKSYLPKATRDLNRATVSSQTFVDMERQIEVIYD